MSTPSQIYDALGSSAQAANAAAQDDDPDQAARAMQLSDATGVPAPAIFGDVEGFEAQHKVALGSAIIDRNAQIASYLKSHPLAPSVSHDDLGALDEASRKMSAIGTSSKLGEWLASNSIQRSFMEGFGDEPIGSSAFQKPSDLEYAINHPLIGAAGAAAATPMEVIGRTFSGLIHLGHDGVEDLFGKSFADEMASMAEWAATRGDIGVHAEASPAKLSEANAQLFRSMTDAVGHADLYTRAGAEPPAGIHPIIDDIKRNQAEADGEALDAALKASAASATRERSPDLYAEFARQHFGDRTIGISPDAIRDLYGDSDPRPDDGKLGWIPNLKEELESAEASGGDVRVSLADWLAKVEPEVAKELHDNIRVRDGGLTLEEAKAEPAPEVGQEPLQSIRGAAGLEPMFSIGDRKITLQRMAQGEAPSTEPSQFGQAAGFHDFDILDERGSKIGSINISEQHGGKQLYVDMIQAGANKQMYDPNFLGPSLIRDLLRQLKAEFPNAESITGHRVSGAREKAGSYMGSSASPVVKFDETSQGWSSIEPFRDLIKGVWERRAGTDYDVFRGEKTLDQQVLSQAVENEIRRIAPQMLGDVTTTAQNIRFGSIGTAAGIYQRFRSFLPDIIVSLEGTQDPVGTGRHEAIHHLRQYGFLNEAEWTTLSRAARDNDWMEKHGIGTNRYKSLSMPDRLEEAIAEEYRTWRGGKDTAPTAHPIFEKIKQFFEAIRTKIKELTGQDLDWEEIFKKIDTGEVGSRESFQPIGEESKMPFVPKLSEERETLYHGTSKDKGFKKLRTTRNGTWFTTDSAEASQYAIENDSMGHSYEMGRFEPTNIAARVIPMHHNFANTLNLKEWPEELTKAVNYKKAQGDYFDKLRAEGYDSVRVPTKDNHSIVVSLDNSKLEPKYSPGGFGAKFSEGQAPDPKDLFSRANAIGMTGDAFKRYMDLIAKRHAEDLQYHQVRAETEQRRKLTKEWKDAEREVRAEVEDSYGSRPDVLVDSIFGRGQFKLDPTVMTEAQRALLPKDYLSERSGVKPDDIAGYFGYHSGDALVERLGLFNSARLRSGMSKPDFAKKAIDDEVARQIAERFPDLEKQILDEAKDQAISETQVNLLHEETVALALKAGADMPLTKEQVKAANKDMFDRQAVGGVSTDALLAAAGRAGRAAEEALLKADYAEAFRQKQRQNNAIIQANLAKRYEKSRAQLDRTAKIFRKREVSSVEPEYQNHIQDLLARVGYRVNRSVQNIAENIARQSAKDLEAFINEKLVESWGYRDLYFADFLSDPSWRKPIDELSVADFGHFKKTIDSLVKNGHSEQKVYREGEAFDRKEVLKDMKGQVRSFPKREIKSGAEPGLARQYIAGSTAIPTLMNRFDRDNARGVFHKFVVYPLTRAANYESRLEREITKPYRELGDPGDLHKLIDRPPAMTGWRYSTFTQENKLGLIQNMGNKSNWVVTAKGWGADPDQLMQWVFRNSTKAEFDRAQKMGDTIFNDLIGKADNVYEHLNGITIDKIPLEPIHTPFGDYRGWYHPLIPDPVWKGKQPLRGGGFDDNYGHIATSNGYTRSRTGAVYPVDLSFGQVPKRIKQMIHDIAFREPILEVQKLFRDSDLHNTITAHYGQEYAKLLMPYLEDIAGKQGDHSDLWNRIEAWSEWLRQNTIGTYIGYNPFTVAKHAPTAAFMSAADIGPARMGAAYSKLFGQSPEVGKTWFQFAVDNSEELQRRDRHWQDTFAAQQKQLYGDLTWRERNLQWGSWPVAFSDKMSAVPLWIARFQKSIEEGSTFGEAVDIADRSVSRQHGSTAITNQPALVRGGGPLHGWLTSVYGFFGTVMQRRIEAVYHANDVWQLGREGEIRAAAKRIPQLAADFMTYVVIPTAIEEMVTSLTTEDHEGWGTYLAKASARGVASSFLYLRDLIHAFTTGQEPGVGLLSSPLHDLEKTANDAKAGRGAFSRQHAGKTVDDFITTFGEATGLAPKVLGNAARFGIDYYNNQAHPKSTGEVLRGITRGDPKRRVEK